MKALAMDRQEIAALQHVTDSLCRDVSYRLDPQYGYLPASFDVGSTRWGSVESAYNEAQVRTGVVLMLAMLNNAGQQTADRLHYIQSHITQATGFDSFSFLNQGTGTLVLLGKSDLNIAVLRISLAPDAKCNRLRDDCVRGPFPGLLQGMAEPLNIDDVIRVEILPFVETRRVGGTPGRETFHHFFSKVSEGTCFVPDILEAAVLPDKTILILDPGECPYTPDYWEQAPAERQVDEEESVLLVERRLALTPAIPESLRWLTPNGALKQDLIYESPPTDPQTASAKFDGPDPLAP